jgi:hypothetical protein
LPLPRSGDASLTEAVEETAGGNVRATDYRRQLDDAAARRQGAQLTSDLRADPAGLHVIADEYSELRHPQADDAGGGQSDDFAVGLGGECMVIDGTSQRAGQVTAGDVEPRPLEAGQKARRRTLAAHVLDAGRMGPCGTADGPGARWIFAGDHDGTPSSGATRASGLVGAAGLGPAWLESAVGNVFRMLLPKSR